MPKARQEEIQWLAGHYYHLYNRSTRRVTIFREERNYRFVLTRINEYCTALARPSTHRRGVAWRGGVWWLGDCHCR